MHFQHPINYIGSRKFHLQVQMSKQNEEKDSWKKDLDLLSAFVRLGIGGNKSGNKRTQIAERDQEEDDDMKYSKVLHVPKLPTPFSYYGRTKYLIIDKKNQLQTYKEKLESLGWTQIMEGIYESPVIPSFRDHNIELQNFLDIFQDFTDIEIVATYGAISSKSLSSK